MKGNAVGTILVTSINVDWGDDNGIIISDTVTLNYGVGDTFESALFDYCESVLEWGKLSNASEPKGEIRTGE